MQLGLCMLKLFFVVFDFCFFIWGAHRARGFQAESDMSESDAEQKRGSWYMRSWLPLWYENCKTSYEAWESDSLSFYYCTRVLSLKPFANLIYSTLNKQKFIQVKGDISCFTAFFKEEGRMLSNESKLVLFLGRQRLFDPMSGRIRLLRESSKATEHVGRRSEWFSSCSEPLMSAFLGEIIPPPTCPVCLIIVTVYIKLKGRLPTANI